jgi:hypothetical protein
MRWRGLAATVNNRPILSSDRMLHKDYDRIGSVEKVNLTLTKTVLELIKQNGR